MPDSPKKYSKPRRHIAWDILKVVVIALAIALAGWSIAVRGDRIQDAEMLTDMLKGGAKHAVELQDLKSMIDRGEMQEAIIGLREILREDDNNFAAHYFLGIAYAKRGLSAEALREFDRTLELGGWEARALYNKGVIYESIGFNEQAYAAYEAARALDPENREYNRARDRNNYVVGDPGGVETQYQLRFNEASAALIRVPPDLDFAANTFEYLAKEFPQKPQPLHMLGVARAKQGRLDDAEAIFRQVISLEPGYTLSYYNLGILHQTRGNWAEARDAFMSCLNLLTDDVNREIVSTHIRQVKEKLGELS